MLSLFFSMSFTWAAPVPSINSSALKTLSFSDTGRLDELFDQTAINKPNAEIKLQFEYDGGGNGKGGLATLYVDGEKVAEGRVDKIEPLVYSADETADVGKDEATQVADKVFKDVDDSEFTGYVTNVTISIPEREN
jgi:hypothetical protein